VKHILAPTGWKGGGGKFSKENIWSAALNRSRPEAGKRKVSRKGKTVSSLVLEAAQGENPTKEKKRGIASDPYLRKKPDSSGCNIPLLHKHYQESKERGEGGHLGKTKKKKEKSCVHHILKTRSPEIAKTKGCEKKKKIGKENRKKGGVPDWIFRTAILGWVLSIHCKS